MFWDLLSSWIGAFEPGLKVRAKHFFSCYSCGDSKAQK
jgi:hypothetical protein